MDTSTLFVYTFLKGNHLAKREKAPNCSLLFRNPITKDKAANLGCRSMRQTTTANSGGYNSLMRIRK